MNQISLFDGATRFKIDKPIRLIELFGGYGSQSLALKYLGVKFEHHLLSEWTVKSIQAYKDLHCPEDNTDYAADMTDEEITDFLDGRISANYATPMTRAQIEKHNGGENWRRAVYNNMVASHNLGSIMSIKGEDLDIVDADKYCYLLTYSFPCFTMDSLVLTDKGYKKIVDVKVGDSVLTHDNTYKNVVRTFINGKHDIYSVKGMGIDEIKATANHKFYVRELYRKGHRQVRSFNHPQWKELKDLTKNDYLGVAINNNSIIPKWNGVSYNWSDGRKSRHVNNLQKMMDNKDFWWVIGRYMGDGWQRSQGGIIICCDKNEKEELAERLFSVFGFMPCFLEEKTVVKFHIGSKEFSEFVKQFGSGAGNKTINNTIIDLPNELLQEFLYGYLSADGCFTNGVYKATSVSRELIYGIAQCVAKVYKTPYRIYKVKVNPKKIIDGRLVNQKDWWQLVFKTEKKKQDKAFYENGHIWFPIKDIQFCGEENVYDIEVEKNHSFTVQNVIVHNCQDLSSAGKGAGMEKGSGTRSGLLWEVERILTETDELPQVLLMENVPEVVGKKNMPQFAKWLAFLDELGYKTKWEVLNTKDFGIPQNRARCFAVSVLGDYYYDMPKEFPLKKRLKDVLEKRVDESYYLKDETIKALNIHKARHDAKGNGFGWKPTDGGGYAATIKTESGYRPDSNFIVEQSRQDGREVYGSSKHDNGKGLQGLWKSSNECSNGNTPPHTKHR